MENILNVSFLSYEKVCNQIGIPLKRKFVVLIFHPVTLEHGTEQEQVQDLIEAMKQNISI